MNEGDACLEVKKKTKTKCIPRFVVAGIGENRVNASKLIEHCAFILSFSNFGISFSVSWRLCTKSCSLRVAGETSWMRRICGRITRKACFTGNFSEPRCFISTTSTKRSQAFVCHAADDFPPVPICITALDGATLEKSSHNNSLL